jgi:hypothetical protein
MIKAMALFVSLHALATPSHLPSIHLVRVNDPSGMQGFDLSCEPGAQAGEEPICSVTEVKASRTVQKTTVALERAQKIAAEFLAKMPKEKIYQDTPERRPNPPVADVLLVWNVRFGGKGTEGILKRKIPEAERDMALQRAVLLLESELAQNEE